MSQFYNNAVFWIEVDKIKPNPFQPRREFDESQLKALSESIRQYGVLQAIVVTRKEVTKPDGGIVTEYELIAGERRWRASKLAGLREVPALIKTGDESDLMKLELAIIENVQREDLNSVDRARAFQRLVEEFGFKHAQIAEKVGKSREYVTNSIRILALPQIILDALGRGEISEGHARPLGMLNDRPEEQATLLKEILYKKLTVREAENIARRVAFDKVRKKEKMVDPEIVEFEHQLAESLGTRVQIEQKDTGGKIVIDYFSADDLRSILSIMKSKDQKSISHMLDAHIAGKQQVSAGVVEAQSPQEAVSALADATTSIAQLTPVVGLETPAFSPTEPSVTTQGPLDDRTPQEVKAAESEDEEMYSIKNFSI